ncbi:hypothetical protein [Streptomyces sp. NPDC003015]
MIRPACWTWCARTDPAELPPGVPVELRGPGRRPLFALTVRPRGRRHTSYDVRAKSERLR